MSQPRPDLPAWRSLLFVPVTRDKFVASAHTRGADAIILDLEDSVPEAEKARARTLVPAAAKAVSKSGADVLVRINRPWHQAFRDIEAAVGPGVAALMCPKVESAEHLRVIAELLDTLEAERGLPHGPHQAGGAGRDGGRLLPHARDRQGDAAARRALARRGGLRRCRSAWSRSARRCRSPSRP